MKYEEAKAELMQILETLQEGHLSIEAMREAVERARELIQICRESLRHTEDDIQQLLDALE